MDDCSTVKTPILEARLAKIETQRAGLKYLAANVQALNLTAECVLARLRLDLKNEAKAIEAELALRDARGLRTPIIAASDSQAVSHA